MSGNVATISYNHSVNTRQIPTVPSLPAAGRWRAAIHACRIAAVLLLGNIAWSDEPLPAGSERIILGNHGGQVITEVLENELYYGGKHDDPTMRIVDVEIVSANEDPADVFGFSHRVSVVRVPNKGDLKVEKTLFTGSAPHPEVQAVQDSQEKRIIDLEFRMHVFDHGHEFVDPRYSFLAIPNEGLQYSEWDWIPATPLGAFWGVLDDWEDIDWRPVDIEFAELDGEVFACAIVVPNPTFEFATHLPTHHQFLSKNHFKDELYELAQAGWQLIDVEIAPDTSQITMGYFGIFVNVGQNIEFLPKVSKFELELIAGLGDEARPIDIELNGKVEVGIYMDWGSPTSIGGYTGVLLTDYEDE